MSEYHRIVKGVEIDLVGCHEAFLAQEGARLSIPGEGVSILGSDDYRCFKYITSIFNNDRTVTIATRRGLIQESYADQYQARARGNALRSILRSFYRETL